MTHGNDTIQSTNITFTPIPGGDEHTAYTKQLIIKLIESLIKIVCRWAHYAVHQ